MSDDEKVGESPELVPDAAMAPEDAAVPAEEAVTPAEDAATPEPEAAEPGKGTAPVPVTAYAAPVDDELEAPRPRTGLVIVMASIVLLLIALVAGMLVLYPALQKKAASPAATQASVSRAKIETGIGFVKALLNGQTMQIKAFLPDSVQGAISESEWTGIAAQDASAVVSFAPAVWTGDSKAVIALQSQDTTGTMTFTINPAKPLAVVMTADIDGSTEVDTVTLVAAGTGWRVVSISNGTDTTVFDDALVKSMVSTDTANPSSDTTP